MVMEESNTTMVEESNVEQTKQSTLTYEQLTEIAHQYSKRAYELERKVKEMEMFNTFKRLDYLFKVIEYSDIFMDSKDYISDKFVHDSINEIKEIMTFPEPKEDSSEKSEDTDSE